MSAELGVVDLTTMLRAVQPLVLGGGADTGGGPRTRVRVLDGSAADVRQLEVLPVACYIDGVQSIRQVSVRSGRPVYLSGVLAGSIDPHRQRLTDEEGQLALICSHLDEDWARSLPGGCPVAVADASDAYGIAVHARHWTDARRRSAEQTVLGRAEVYPDVWVVLDGDLRDVDRAGLEPTARVIGVVKTTARQYLTDEHQHLHALDEGHVSIPFVLPADRRDQLERATCYLRQRDATYRSWDFGLVRVELPAEHAGLLHRAAASVFAGRQLHEPGDQRWDRQQWWIARLEKVLRQRLPHVLRGH